MSIGLEPRRGGIVVRRDRRLLSRASVSVFDRELVGAARGFDRRQRDFGGWLLDANASRRPECGQNLKLLLVYYPGLDNVDNRTSLYYCEEAKSVLRSW